VFAHFFDSIGKKKKILLSIPPINGSHTGEAIADSVVQDHQGVWPRETRGLFHPG
jgi:hypothetical protein